MERNIDDYEAVVRGVIGAAALALAVSRRNLIWLGISALTFYSAASRRSLINDLSLGSRKRANLHPVPTLH